MGILFWFLLLGTSAWVLYDAKKIGVKKGQLGGALDLGPWDWLILCLLLWYVGFILYLAKREELKRINGK